MRMMSKQLRTYTANTIIAKDIPKSSYEPICTVDELNLNMDYKMEWKGTRRYQQPIGTPVKVATEMAWLF